MSTQEATYQAVGRLLEEAHHRTQRADLALTGGDQELAHDEFMSARALLDVVCILTDWDEEQHDGRAAFELVE